MKKATLLLTLLAVGCISMAQGYVVLTDSTMIVGTVVDNYPTRLLFQTDDGFALITKDRIAEFQLRDNNLLPAPHQPVKAKDVYEAFLRFDDKPMITGIEAVSKSIQKYCINGEFSVATGDGTNFTRYFSREQIPFFDVNDSSYWLVDNEDVPSKPAEVPPGDTRPASPTIVHDPQPIINKPAGDDSSSVRQFKAITVSGKVPLDHYTALFGYFISPFVMNGNKIEIEVSFKIKSSSNSPIDESKQQYKSAKEAAKQLGMDFEEES